MLRNGIAAIACLFVAGLALQGTEAAPPRAVPGPVELAADGRDEAAGAGRAASAGAAHARDRERSAVRRRHDRHPQRRPSLRASGAIRAERGVAEAMQAAPRRPAPPAAPGRPPEDLSIILSAAPDAERDDDAAEGPDD